MLSKISRRSICTADGSGLNFYQGSNFQRGYGFGGIFRSLLLAAAPLLQSDAKTLGKQMWQSVLEVVNDVRQGQNFPTEAKRRMKETAHQDEAANKMKTMIGSGRNKKRKLSKKRVSSRLVKKVKARDIFS